MRYSDGWRRTYALHHLRKLQEGVCAICLAAPARFTVDHCHKTGEIRGAICHRCNVVVSYYERGPEPERLPAVANYLHNPPGRNLVAPGDTEKAALIAVLDTEDWVRPYHRRQLGL